MDKTAVNALFHFLSEPGRRELVRLLAEAPLAVGEISEVLALPQSTVSRHLKDLRATGLLADRRDGTRTINRLVEPNGSRDLPDLLNQWLRQQPVSGAIQTRLNRVLSRRNGEEDIFERLAHQWDETRQRYFGCQFHLDALCTLLPTTWNVLDIGTGTGYLLPTLARQFSRVTAVDPSAAMLSLARQRIQKQGLPNVQFRFGRLESLPVPSESIDLALAVLVLHHSTRLADALRETHRVLRGNGILLVVDIVPHEMENFQKDMEDPVRGIDPDFLVQSLSEVGFQLRRQRSLEILSPGLPGGPEQAAPDLYLIQAART